MLGMEFGYGLKLRLHVVKTDASTVKLKHSDLLAEKNIYKLVELNAGRALGLLYYISCDLF